METEGKYRSPEIRRDFILKQLRDHDAISTQDIARRVHVAEITIRRDLALLEEKGLLIRTRSGAVKQGATDDLFAYDDKINLNRAEKEYICRIAAGFVNPGDVIFIDCGSTVSLLTQYIKKIESLTVITNSLPIASELIHFGNVKLIIIGGEIEHKRKAIYGYSAINNIAHYHANKAFIGADGISLQQGITSYNEKYASVTLKMAENCDESFLLCDSSKIEKNSFVKFAPVSAVDYVITDQKIDPAIVARYNERNVRLLCEEPKEAILKEYP